MKRKAVSGLFIATPRLGYEAVATIEAECGGGGKPLRR
jgi:hypothetical protein